MIHIGFYLRVPVIIVDATALIHCLLLLLLLLLVARAATAGSAIRHVPAARTGSITTTGTTVIGDGADRLVFLVRTAGHILLWLKQARVLWSALCVAAVVPAAARERIVSALKLARHLFVSGATARNQHHVETGQPEYRNGEQRHDGHQNHGHDWFHLGQLVLFLVQHVHERKRKYAQHVHRQRDEEEEKEPIVPSANTVVYPWAVMVKRLNAVVAHGAVRAARRTVEFTRNAPFHAHRNAVNFCIFVERRTELVLPIFVWWSLRYNAWIHKRCQGKVRYDEERDDGLVRRHPWMPLDVELPTWIPEKQEGGAEQQGPGECGRDISRLDVTFRHFRSNPCPVFALHYGD